MGVSPKVGPLGGVGWRPYLRATPDHSFLPGALGLPARRESILRRLMEQPVVRGRLWLQLQWAWGLGSGACKCPSPLFK